MDNYKYDWVESPEKDDIIEMLETSQPIYFQFQNADYLIETYVEGVLIAEPFLYYKNGGFPNDPKYQYNESFKSKTVNEFLNLTFLDGKTLFEQWDNIRFWDF